MVVIDVLSYARIARVTRNEPKSFAFVQRRFLECLVTTRLLDRPEMGRGCLKIGGNGYWERAEEHPQNGDSLSQDRQYVSSLFLSC